MRGIDRREGQPKQWPVPSVAAPAGAKLVPDAAGTPQQAGGGGSGGEHDGEPERLGGREHDGGRGLDGGAARNSGREDDGGRGLDAGTVRDSGEATPLAATAPAPKLATELDGGRSTALAATAAAAEPGTEREATKKRPKSAVLALAAGIALVLAVAVAALVLHAGRPAHARPVTDGTSGTAAGRKGARAAVPAGPFRVLSVTPAAGVASADGSAPLRVAFSSPLAADSPTPLLRPEMAGRWQIAGSTMTFVPAKPLLPRTRVTLRIPGGPSGIRTAAGGTLSRGVVARYTTAGYSPLRLAQLLSQLGYLPVSWRPVAGPQLRVQGQPAGSAAETQQEMAYEAPAGQFIWASGYPEQLHRLWVPSQPNPLVRGALIAFESQHRMALDGIASLQLWRALFHAAHAGQLNAAGYSYALASKASPETLTIWHDGRVVLHSLANTGIPVAPTSNGTFPVYLRYRFQIMRGTNPDGSKYADPVEYVAYFTGGEAVHYFPRGSYGSPQSLGCVELPYAAAKHAWPFLSYGSLVTVAG